jgi:HD-like signal output (HDOD) protein
VFGQLLTSLFPSFTKSKATPNYLVFEQAKSADSEHVEDLIQSISTNEPVIDTPKLYDSDLLNQKFYQYLFGYNETADKNSELCLFVANKIEPALTKPKVLVDCLPVLPVSVTTLLSELKKDDFNTDVLIEVIEKEPSIAGKVIELANTPFYHRGNKEITDLKSAFMCMGSKGLIEGVINGFVSQLTPQSNVYFKQFGEKIWQHSLDTGQLAKYLLENENKSDLSGAGYFVGLILNLGHMVIFQLMMEAFAFIDPESKPDADFFQNIINKYSLQLTYQIAKYWALPGSLLESLIVQMKVNSLSVLEKASNTYPIAAAVYEGNTLSIIETLFNQKKLTKKEVQLLANSLIYSSAAKSYVNKLIENELE